MSIRKTTYLTALLLSMALLFQQAAIADTERGLQYLKSGDFERAFTEFEAAVEKDRDPRAQYRLATMYQRGLGIAGDCKKAAELFLKAADQEYFPAMTTVVQGYARSRFCINGDQEQASLWFERTRILLSKQSADGDADATRSLASLFFNMGHKEEANRWYARLAEQLTPKAESGDPGAQSDLGFLYANGYGVTEDQAEARRWRLKAAAAGHADSQFMIGAASKDPKERLDLWLKAARQGHGWAMYRIGMALLEGQEGIARDEAEGMHWLREAAKRGVDYARDVLRKRTSGTKQ